jgi:hypothetical protein
MLSSEQYLGLRRCGESGHKYIFDEIKKSIENNEPIFIGKIGSIELQLIHQSVLIDIKKLDDYLPYLKFEVTNAAGLYPEHNNFFKLFVNMYLDAIKELDILASWNDNLLPIEEWVYSTFINSKQIINPKYSKGIVDLMSFESFYVDSKYWWQTLFENKTILILSPFTYSISEQLDCNKRDKVWSGKWSNFWPSTIKFKYLNFPHPYMLQSPKVQSTYPQDFVQLIHSYKTKLNDIGEFDIALIGTGCYSIILGSYIKKELKKSAFHLGGGLQMMFGVYGDRWFQNGNMSEFFKQYINEYWTRPSDDEKPSGYKKQENGAYF